jgi:peptidoglycan/LPS O-acetylase OafA/YrhL
MSPQTNRFRELDVLRGLCALAVVIYHYCIRFDALVGFGGIPNLAMDVTSGDVRHWGMAPVYVFFMISGFVITMTLERCRTVGDFALSRFSRIFPAYWIAVLITYVLWEQAPAFAYHVSPTDAALNLTMVQGFFHVPDVDGVYWSLAAELSFYAGMAFLLWRGWLRHLSEICGLWLLLSLASFVFHVPVPWRIAMFLNLDFAQFFIAGIVLYRVWRRQVARFDLVLLLACGAAILLRYPLAPAICLLTAMGTFLMIANGDLGRIAHAPLVFLGSISYSLYLTHQMIGYQVLAHVPGPPAVRVIVAIAFALGLASAVTFLIEQPAQRLIRSYFKPSHSGVARSPWPRWTGAARARIAMRRRPDAPEDQINNPFAS